MMSVVPMVDDKEGFGGNQCPRPPPQPETRQKEVENVIPMLREILGMGRKQYSIRDGKKTIFGPD